MASAYIVLLRIRTEDDEGMKRYADLAANAPTDKIELVASTKLSRSRILEGGDLEAAVIMKFPSWDDALHWYESPEYSKARRHRLASGTFRAVLIEGMDG